MHRRLSYLMRRVARLCAIVAVGLAAAVVGHAQSVRTGAGGHTLRAQDKIEVRVFQEDDLTQQAVVDADGMVRLPLVGSVRVAGLTPDQAAQRIRGAYADGYLVNPQVTVAVVSAARRKLVVTGQVQRPGPVELRAGERFTVLQALAEVGGATRLANLRSVMVKRVSGGRERVFKIDCKAMATDPKIPPFYVEEGDIITVKESLF